MPLAAPVTTAVRPTRCSIGADGTWAAAVLRGLVPSRHRPFGEDGGRHGAVWLTRPTRARRRSGRVRRGGERRRGRRRHLAAQGAGSSTRRASSWRCRSRSATCGWSWVCSTVLEALNDLFGFAGPGLALRQLGPQRVLGICAVLVLARAAYEPVARRAWLAFGIRPCSCGSSGAPPGTWPTAAKRNAPYPSFADVLWLAWYPLIGARDLLPDPDAGAAVRAASLDGRDRGDAAGPGRGVRPGDSAGDGAQDGRAPRRRRGLRLSRCSMCCSSGPSSASTGCSAGSPTPCGCSIGLAIVSTSVADAVFAVQEAEARAVVSANSYNFVWTAGALLIALAAWAGSPEADANAEAVTGMRAVALALFAQALAIGIQLYAIFREVGRSERIVTIVVLVVASVQIILTRPRRKEGGEDARGPAPTRGTTSRNARIREECGGGVSRQAAGCSDSRAPDGRHRPVAMSRGSRAVAPASTSPRTPGRSQPGTR